MSSIEVTFIRHGESVSNVAHRWQGQGDAPLSERGRRQAAALGGRLRNERYELVVSSDLSRAHDTAKALGVAVELDASWREIDVGRWEGLGYTEVFAQFPEEMERLRRGEPVKIGGGESWDDLHARVDGALERLRERMRPGERAAVVAHGGVILGVTSGILESRAKRLQPFGRMGNTGVTTVRLSEEGRWVLHRYNDSTHLDPLGPFTAEHLEGGDPVVTLVGFDPRADAASAERPEAGTPATAARLATWYPALDAVFAVPERGPRDFAASLADRYGQRLGELPAAEGRALAPLVSTLARAGCRVGLVAPVESIADYAESLLPPSGRGGRRVAPPEHGSVTHVVATDRFHSVTEYNLGG